jgi:heme A synthase
LVAIHVFLLASKVLREPNIGETIRKPANAIWVLLVLQLALGIGSYLGKYPVIGDTISPSMIITLTSAHVLVGALLFATSIMLALRIHGGWLRTRFGTMPQEASAT